MEIWKAIPGFEGLYQVSNLGNVKNSREYSPHTDSKRTMFGKLLNQRLNNAGYCRVRLSKNDGGKDFFVHRLVALAFVKQPEGKNVVNHIDGCKTSNHASNLEWVTHSENNYHASNKGLVNHRTKKKMKSLAQLQLNNRKKVTILDANDNVLGTFESLKDASIHFGFNEKYFSNVVKKGVKKYKVILED